MFGRTRELTQLDRLSAVGTKPRLAVLGLHGDQMHLLQMR
jgi:hypothetical protein